MEGWIKLWRKLLLNGIMKKERLLQIFIYCLLRANHKEEMIIFNGQQIHLMPGQFVTGRHEASIDLGLKSIMWDRKVKELEKLQIVNRKVNNQFSIISIINWQSYQGSDKINEQPNEQRMNNGRTTDEQRMNTDKNVKNDKNVKKKEIYSEQFLNWWSFYPNKKGKKSAFKEWCKASPDTAQLINAVKNQILYKAELNRNGKFCPEWPDPERWIKDARWEDELTKTEKPDDPYKNWKRF